MAKQKLNVAIIGYGFMGRAHSNAYRKVGNFFDLEHEPVMKVGMTGQSRPFRIWPMPGRKRCSSPSGLRQPSGNHTRISPLFNAARAMAKASPGAPWATGKMRSPR